MTLFHGHMIIKPSTLGTLTILVPALCISVRYRRHICWRCWDGSNFDECRILELLLSLHCRQTLSALQRISFLCQSLCTVLQLQTCLCRHKIIVWLKTGSVARGRGWLFGVKTLRMIVGIPGKNSEERRRRNSQSKLLYKILGLSSSRCFHLSYFAKIVVFLIGVSRISCHLGDRVWGGVV